MKKAGWAWLVMAVSAVVLWGAWWADWWVWAWWIWLVATVVWAALFIALCFDDAFWAFGVWVVAFVLCVLLLDSWVMWIGLVLLVSVAAFRVGRLSGFDEGKAVKRRKLGKRIRKQEKRIRKQVLREAMTCPECDGTGVCSECDGEGRNRVISGPVEAAGTCPACGAVVYSYGGDGDFFCPECDGTGDCPGCDGTGDCSHCHGSGKTAVAELLRGRQ